MSATIYYELQLLAASLAVGLCLMAVYDGLRIFRVLVPHKSLWTGIEDAAYWLASSISTFLLLFRQNDGILRWYAIGGVLLGMLLYNMTVSRILLRLLKKSEKYFTIRRTKRRVKKRQKRIAKQQKREKKRLELEEKKKAAKQRRLLRERENQTKRQEKRRAKQEKQQEMQKDVPAQFQSPPEEQGRPKNTVRMLHEIRNNREIGDAVDAGKRKSTKKEKRKSE